MTDYATDVICQFARVLHVRDFICAYASVLSFCLLMALEALLRAILSRVQGVITLLPSRHERARAAAQCQGAAVGGSAPPSSMAATREAKTIETLPCSRACNAQICVSACNARYRRKNSYITYGHSIYLMITVPIDTMFIINNLQIFNVKNMGQIIQIGG